MSEVKSLINIGGQVLNAAEVSLPPDSRFQDAWVFVDGAIQEDTAKKRAIMAKLVNAERDRRLVADFMFKGVRFQRDPASLQRITGAATLAGFAMGAGAQPGNLRWANSDRDFVWIAADNTLVPMDAQTCFAFGQVAASVETTLIFKAKALREMDPIPEDYSDDKWWT